MSGDIRVRLHSNSTEFKNDMKSLANQMKNVKAEFEANRTSVDQWGNQLKQSETKMTFLTQQMDLQRQKVNALKQAFEDSAQKKGQDAQETQNLAKRLNYATAELNKMQNELTQTNQKLDQFKENESINKFSNDMNSLSLAMKKVDADFKLVSSSAENFGNDLKQTSLHGVALTDKLEVQRQAVNRLEQEYQRVAQAKGLDATETKQLAIRLNEAQAGLNGIQNELSQTEQRLVQLGNELKQQSSAWGKFTNNMDTVGNKMQQVGGSVAATSAIGFATMTFAMKDAVTVGMEFGAQISRVGAISDASSAQLKQLKDQALQLGASTSKSASEVAKGQESLAALGMTVNEVIGAMPGVISAAEASGADMAQTAEVMASTLNIFGMEASKATEVADILAKTANVSAADITDMQYALKYAGPPAKALGISLEELSASIGILTNAGMEGEQAGTTLRGALLALLNPSEENSKMMTTMGISITDASGNFVGLSKLVDNLSKSMKGQTETQKAATLASLVGTEAVSGMLSLMAAGPSEINKMTVALENSAGSSAKAAAQMKDNLKGAIDEMNGAIETAKIKFTDGLTPAIKGVSEIVASLVEKWNSLDEGTQQIIATSTALGTAMLGVTAIVGTLTLGVGALLTFAGPVGLAIVGATAALGALGIGMNAVKQHTENLKKEQEQAEIVARRYGDGLSEGTLKGVKGYTDLYEGAKLKMVQLQTMSGEKAKATSQEVVTAFSEMANNVVTALETQKTKLTAAINDVYGVAGETGTKKANELTNEIIARFDKDIANYRKSLDTLKTAHEKYNNDMSKMPADFAKVYQEALKVMDGGSKEFAKSQKELQVIQKNIASKQGQILFEEAQGYTKSINDTYDKSLKYTKKYYADKEKEFKKGLTQGKLEQDEFDNAMIVLEAKKNEMLAKAAQEREKSLSVLAKNLDDQGKLVDIATGKLFERQQTQIVDYSTGTLIALDETNKDYLARWQKHTQEVLKSNSDFSEKTKGEYQKNLAAFLQTQGTSVDASIKIAKEMVDQSLAEMGKGNEKAKKAGADKTQNHAKGIESKKPEVEKASKNVTNALDKGLAEKKLDAEKHGADKGKNHAKGAESTVQANTTGGKNVTKGLNDGLGADKEKANQHGKDKGTAFGKGAESTKGSTSAIGKTVADFLSQSLGKATDGGGGKKAGTELGKGLLSQQGSINTSATNLANTAKSGLKTADGNPIGKEIARGFSTGMESGTSGVIQSAINLAKSAIKAAKKALDINSPSGEAKREVGHWYTAGVAEGMLDNIGAVQSAAVRVAQAITPNITDRIAITKEELAKFNNVIATVNKQQAKEINDIHTKASKDREVIINDANKRIHVIELAAKEKKRKLTSAELRKINDIEEKAATDRKKIADKESKDIATINKTANADKIKALQDYVEKRKTANTMTLEQEIAFWQQANKIFKNGSQEQLDAQKKLNSAKDQLNKQAQQIDEDYLTKVKDLNQKFIDEEKRLNDAYQKTWEDKVKFLTSTGLFDEVVQKDVIGETLMNNLESQVVTFENWQKNLAELASKGISDELLKEIESMGPRASEEVAALNTLTTEQLTKYVSLWEQKNRLAREQATKELEGMRIDTANKIEQLRQDTAKQLVIYQDEWRLAMVNAKITVKNQLAEMPSIGVFAVSGLIAGMESQKSALEAKARELAAIVESSMKSELDINSPSRKIEKNVARWIPAALVSGMLKNINSVKEASKQLAVASMPNISGVAQTIGNAANVIRTNTDFLTVRNIIQTPVLEKKMEQMIKLLEQSGTNSTPAITIENMSFHSPKNLNPYETARMNRNALRELAMQL